MARFVIVSFLLAVYISIGLLSRGHQRFQLWLSSTFSRWILAVLGGRVRSWGSGAGASGGRPALIVANHQSDMDILVLQSLRPSVFITSFEVRQTRLLGAIARAGGAFFIERRNRFGLREEIRRVEQVLKEGFDVVLFAEGTTGNGEQVLPFRSALFDAAIRAGAVLAPVCLQYRSIGDQPVSLLNRDTLFYYGDMGFARHFWKLCTAGGFEVDCGFLAPLQARKGLDRSELARKVRDQIVSAFEPILSQ